MSEISQLSLLTSMAASGAILGAESPDAPYAALYTPSAIGGAIGLPQNISSINVLRTTQPAKGKFANVLQYYSGKAGGGGMFFGAAQSIFNATITGTGLVARTLTVTSDPSEPIYPGMILSGSGVALNVYVLMQQSGFPGGQGTYVVSTTTNVDPAVQMTAKFVDDGGLIVVPTGGDGSVAWVRSLVSTAMLFGEYWGIKADYVTDDAPAANAAHTALAALGGHLVYPKGRCKFESQVKIIRYPTYPTPFPTWPSSGGSPPEWYGIRNLSISGYGCEIHTVGAISGFELEEQTSYAQISIRGFYFYHQNNTQAVAAIRAFGTHCLTIEENTFLLNNTLPATYAAILFENTDPAVNDGAILSTIHNNTFNRTEGTNANCCIAMYGGQNGVKITHNNFGSANKHIYISNYPGQLYTPNSTVIAFNAFEGGGFASTGIILNQDNPANLYHVTGTRIIANRIETIGTFLSLEGTASAIQTPTYLAGNSGIISCPNYIKNPNNVPINSLDVTGVSMPTGPVRQFNNMGYDFGVDTAAPFTFTGSITGDILTVTAAPTKLIINSLLLTGVNVLANTTILWQESSTEAGGGYFGTGTYRVSVNHATTTGSQTITASPPPSHVFRIHRADTDTIGPFGISYRRTGINRFVELAKFSWRDFATGTDRYQMLWSGVTYKLGFSNVIGLSSTTTPARNFRGSAAITHTGAGPWATTITFINPITLVGQDEPNGNYQIILDVPANVTAWVTGKSATGFTINTSGTFTGTVLWTLIR